jgi:hypothetical protein
MDESPEKNNFNLKVLGYESGHANTKFYIKPL